MLIILSKNIKNVTIQNRFNVNIFHFYEYLNLYERFDVFSKILNSNSCNSAEAEWNFTFIINKQTNNSMKQDRIKFYDNDPMKQNKFRDNFNHILTIIIIIIEMKFWKILWKKIYQNNLLLPPHQTAKWPTIIIIVYVIINDTWKKPLKEYLSNHIIYLCVWSSSKIISGIECEKWKFLHDIHTQEYYSSWMIFLMDDTYRECIICIVEKRHNYHN